MNKFIKQQLNKITEVNINFNDNDTHIYIPKKQTIKLTENCSYIIKLSDSVLNGTDQVLLDNWNLGVKPTERYYKIDIIKKVNPMINVFGIGYDIDTKEGKPITWTGWLPETEFEIIERI